MGDRLSVEELMMLGGWGEEAGKEISELQRYATQLEAENERLMGIVEGQDSDDSLPSLRAEIRELRKGKVGARAVLESLMADNAKFREALEKCGKHQHPCPKWSRHARSTDKCNCGLDDALKEHNVPVSSRDQEKTW